jgi:hypothetical protein
VSTAGPSHYSRGEGGGHHSSNPNSPSGSEIDVDEAGPSMRYQGTVSPCLYCSYLARMQHLVRQRRHLYPSSFFAGGRSWEIDDAPRHHHHQVEMGREAAPAHRPLSPEPFRLLPYSYSYTSLPRIRIRQDSAISFGFPICTDPCTWCLRPE